MKVRMIAAAVMSVVSVAASASASAAHLRVGPMKPAHKPDLPQYAKIWSWNN